MSKNTGDGELEEIRALDTIQRNIWRRINQEAIARGIKWKTGDAYCLGSVIKEVLHPEVKKWSAQEANKAQQQLLQGLLEQMPDDTIVATKYGYHSREKKYGFRMGMHEAQSVIQNKLEGLS